MTNKYALILVVFAAMVSSFALGQEPDGPLGPPTILPPGAPLPPDVPLPPGVSLPPGVPLPPGPAENFEPAGAEPLPDEVPLFPSGPVPFDGGLETPFIDAETIRRRAEEEAVPELPSAQPPCCQQPFGNGDDYKLQRQISTLSNYVNQFPPQEGT